MVDFEVVVVEEVEDLVVDVAEALSCWFGVRNVDVDVDVFVDELEWLSFPLFWPLLFPLFPSCP